MVNQVKLELLDKNPLWITNIHHTINTSFYQDFTANTPSDCFHGQADRSLFCWSKYSGLTWLSILGGEDSSFLYKKTFNGH